jgi:oxygen-dependent protoporphyrinogen oxidase
MRFLASNGLGARQRLLATAFRSQHRAFHAAVIGGGITGLTSAFHLVQHPKCSGVTIYEKSPRLGGWMRSERVSVKGGDVLFEYGPRTLRCSETLVPLWYMVTVPQLNTATSNTKTSNDFLFLASRLNK